jgi:NAD(P)-dependent dehydrogenase (short-subunit alcohol dehydrogenase family)
MNPLDKKTAVITGATRGFGLEVARAFGRAGANLVITARSANDVETTINSLRHEGFRVSGIACDVSQLENVENLANHAIQKFGDFDIWVNNAAISAPYGPSIEIATEEFSSVLQTNIFSAYYGTLVAMQNFLPRRQGKLINISGRGDRGSQPMQNAYASSKAWLRNFTLGLANEYKNSGVGVFLLNPGMMITDMTQNVTVVRGYEDRLANFGNILRFLAIPPEESAQKAVWLASSDTDGKTGLVVRQMNVPKMLMKLFDELFKRLTGRSEKPVDISITLVPPAMNTTHPHQV